jgi:hypothetical protein
LPLLPVQAVRGAEPDAGGRRLGQGASVWAGYFTAMREANTEGWWYPRWKRGCGSAPAVGARLLVARLSSRAGLWAGYFEVMRGATIFKRWRYVGGGRLRRGTLVPIYAILRGQPHARCRRLGQAAGGWRQTASNLRQSTASKRLRQNGVNSSVKQRQIGVQGVKSGLCVLLLFWVVCVACVIYSGSGCVCASRGCRVA